MSRIYEALRKMELDRRSSSAVEPEKRNPWSFSRTLFPNLPPSKQPPP